MRGSFKGAVNEKLICMNNVVMLFLFPRNRRYILIFFVDPVHGLFGDVCGHGLELMVHARLDDEVTPFSTLQIRMYERINDCPP